MARKKKPKRKVDEKLELQMTPMIDVVFQLLVFFMCATKFKTLEGRVDAFLPKDVGESSGKPSEFDSIVVRIAQDGNLTVNGISCAGLKAFFEQLKRLKQVMPKPKVILDPHPLVEHQYVMRSLDICRKAGLYEVAFRAPMPPRDQ